MDSSSIVSFNNDTTYQTTLKADYNNINVHELALHAMRDRCLLLQRRINTLETDNMRLKLDITKAKTSYAPLKEDEKLSLLQKIAELSKQKSTLLHHVFMVSCENKSLWNKLSTMKGNDKAIKDHIKQPLIRKNTYIHSTPKYNTQNQEKFSDSSLEEISLKFLNSYILEKSQLVEQYEQMTQLQDVDDDILNVDSIGFTYIEDPVTDSLKEIHHQTENLQNLKKELAQQENNLKIVVSRIETLLKDVYKCQTCEATAEKANTTLEDKETETSSSLIASDDQTESSLYNNDAFDELMTNKKNKSEESEPFDKMCPMCGEKFKKETIFADFQAHVESHFVGENEIDSIDNFDTVPNSLDNVL